MIHADIEDSTGAAEITDQPLLEVEEPTPDMIAAVAGENLELRREQMQLQVAQLAAHLRERLREVDRREAALNARVAQLESDLRCSRLWLQERELAFQEREQELQGQIEELQDRSSASQVERETDTIDVEAQIADLAERDQQIQLHEDDLRQRRFEFDRQTAALRHAQQIWQQQKERDELRLKEDQTRLEHEFAQQRQQLTADLEQIAAQRQEQLRATELLLSEHARQLDADRTALAADRHAWDEQQSRQKQAIDSLRAATEAELADRRTRLEARQEWVERQKSGLEQVRDESLRLHRQALEMRLLAEQLWSQITGVLTPAEVTQAIAQLRLKLADQYKLEEQQLFNRRDELLQLSEKVATEHRDLLQLREGIRQWSAARQTEIERQAETLVQRELELDGQRDEQRRAEHQWNADRRRLEQQIRDLTSRLRSLPVAA